MTGLQELIRRWQIAHYELLRRHFEQERTRSEAILGAYGLTNSGAPYPPSRRSR